MRLLLGKPRPLRRSGDRRGSRARLLDGGRRRQRGDLSLCVIASAVSPSARGKGVGEWDILFCVGAWVVDKTAGGGEGIGEVSAMARRRLSFISCTGLRLVETKAGWPGSSPCKMSTRRRS